MGITIVPGFFVQASKQACFPQYFVFLGVLGLFYVVSTSAIDSRNDCSRNELLCVTRDVKQLLTHSRFSA